MFRLSQGSLVGFESAEQSIHGYPVADSGLDVSSHEQRCHVRAVDGAGTVETPEHGGEVTLKEILPGPAYLGIGLIGRWNSHSGGKALARGVQGTCHGRDHPLSQC